VVVTVSLCLAPGPIPAQPRAAPPRKVRTDVSRPAERGAQPPVRAEQSMIRLDATDAELATVIEMIAGATGKNFIYDDRVRGRVTIISPTEIPIEQAYAVFESVLSRASTPSRATSRRRTATST
jgi:general secretion pathway protein D